MRWSRTARRGVSLTVLVAAIIAAAVLLLLRAGSEMFWQGVSPWSLEASTQPVLTQTLTVTRIYDGDTFVGTNEAGKVFKVRLLGIDTSEVAHSNGEVAECGAEEATRALSHLISGREVEVTTDPVSDTYDRYGRLLAYVSVDDGAGNPIDPAAAQVQNGMAEAWYPSSEPEPSRYAFYKGVQFLAQTDGAGSWSECSTLGR